MIGRICPDADMPTDEHGFVADIVIDPASPIKRMNVGQLYEEGINRISEFVRRRMQQFVETQKDYEAAFDLLIQWYSDVNANYGALVKEIHQTKRQREDLVKETIDTLPSIHIPPTMKLSVADFDRLATKYNMTESRVSFVRTDLKGRRRKFTTQVPIGIGSKYLVCLCKIPHTTSPGVARVSHLGIPTKAGRDAHYSTVVRLNPTKAGEDEIRVSSMDAGPKPVFRLMNFSNAQKATQLQIDTMLRHPHPTQIDRFDISDQELAHQNAILATFHHMTSSLGIETRTTRTYKQAPDFLKDEGDTLGMGNAVVSDYDDLYVEGSSDDDTPTISVEMNDPDAMIVTLASDVNSIDLVTAVPEIDMNNPDAMIAQRYLDGKDLIEEIALIPELIDEDAEEDTSEGEDSTERLVNTVDLD